MASRNAFVHVGTHKTGTKSIQLYVARNVDALRESGIYVPDAGRHLFDENAATPGHHDLANELARGGGKHLAALIAEIGNAGLPSILLSSEEFHPLAPEALAALPAALACADYEATAIVYLRAQAEYATSLYAELAKSNTALRFGAFLRTVLETGRFAPGPGYVIRFEYSQLLLSLAAAFGEARIVTRPYDAAREPAALINDMLRVLATLHPPLRAAALSDPALAVNARSTFGDVLKGIYGGARARYPDLPTIAMLAPRVGIDPSDPRFATPFAPLQRDEMQAFVERFEPDNRQVEAMTNVSIPGALEADVAPPEDARWSIASWQRTVLDLMTDAWLR